MREMLKTRQRQKKLQRKRRRGSVFSNIMVSPPSIVEQKVVAKVHPIVDSKRCLSGELVSAVVVDDINLEIYKFGKKSLFSEFKENMNFREAIMSGAYFYHQGKICLYHPDVFKGGENRIKVSEIVDNNPGDYLLSHDVQPTITVRRTMIHRKNGYYATRKAKNSSNSNASVNHANKYSKRDYTEGNQFSETVLCLLDLVKGFINGGQGGGSNDSFGYFFTSLMTERKLTVSQLADKTDIPERTIIRMRSEEDYKPSIEYLLACCIVMKLPPWDSDVLFELAGIALRPNNKKERCYIALLHVFFKDGSIEICDAVLHEMGLPTLSSIIESNKKNK